jgi:hypothetical protein
VIEAVTKSEQRQRCARGRRRDAAEPAGETPALHWFLRVHRVDEKDRRVDY